MCLKVATKKSCRNPAHFFAGELHELPSHTKKHRPHAANGVSLSGWGALPPAVPSRPRGALSASPFGVCAVNVAGRACQEMKLCALAAVVLASAFEDDALPCSDYCRSSCCGFTMPENECGGCDDSYSCSPGKMCYSADDRPPPPPPTMTPDGVCESFCHGASCCYFSQPQNSCAGCPETAGCHPGAVCYNGQARHEHTPEGGRAKLGTPTFAGDPSQATPPPAARKTRHEHTPPSTPPASASAADAPAQPRKKRHEHTPGMAATPPEGAAAAPRKKRHEHTPASTPPPSGNAAELELSTLRERIALLEQAAATDRALITRLEQALNHAQLECRLPKENARVERDEL